jgi:large subunit ribosomal protein L33
VAKKRGQARVLINLACTECRERTYWSEKNKQHDQGRMELNKFCPRCRRHQLHREVR